LINLLYVPLPFIVIVAGLGIITLALSVFGRTREIGLLRAIPYWAGCRY
jgi:ABC-type lipoprotein release transport system permease subunit